MASDAGDTHSAGHQHFARLDRLVFLDPGYRRDGVDRVLASPSTRGEDFIQPVRVRARIGIRCDTTFAAVAGCCCHKPFDLIFVEWFFESQQYVRNLLRICFMIHLLVRSFEENRAWQFCRGVHGYVLRRS